MAYDGRIMQRALARFDEDKQRRSAQLDQRRRALYAREPRLAEIETELRGTMSRIISSALARGTDPLPAIRVLRDENLALQQERTQLLAAMGYPADYLEEKPACRLCGDTGYANGRVCGCLRAYYAREQLAELSRLLPLGEDSFETFSFDWYDSAVQPAFGVSPRANMEDLGPTFIKLGQILSMRSDILPRDYCEALKKLRSNVSPMPFEQVQRVVETSYGCPMEEVFASFDEKALGSASIAQAHAAILKSGESVVVKVQREGIHEVMSRDIILLKQACKVLKYTPAGSLVDFNQVLDEMWVVAQEEMNFQTEAANLERFHALNQDVVFVTSPILYRAYTTTNVLVMERIDGMGIDEHDKLVEAGYDLAEIGAKLADNYVRQIMEDGFFHADPHPGNIRIRDGKIVWLDMGMMGSLNEKERKLIGNAIVGVARGDIALVRDAVLGLGEFHGTADKKQLYRDIEAMLDKYGSADLGTMDLAEVFEDMTSVMKTNGIAMPSSLTMLARGLATIEGVVADLSPELNIMNVITARIGDQMFDNVDWRALLTQDARAIYESSRKSLEIPALLADILRTGLKGEANLGVEHHAGEDVRKLVIAMVRKLCLMLLSLGLLIFGGAVAGNGPQVFGLSIYSSGCFMLAMCAAGFALWNKKK